MLLRPNDILLESVAYEKKNLFAVEMVVLRYELLAVHDYYLERVSQKLREKKKEKKKKNSLRHAEARARFV